MYRPRPRRTIVAMSETITTTTPAVEVACVRRHAGERQLLHDVTFSVPPGELVALVGGSGAGKTTLLETIAGVLPADGGDVRWHGKHVTLPRRRELMFYLPDGLRPWDGQYAASVLEFFAAAYGRPASVTAQAIGTLGLAPVLRKRVGALSKGYCRRLMLALALIAPQPLLLMDEPFDGFDLRQTREIMTVLREVARAGRALVLAIHQLADAERVCDRFVLLVDGRVRGAGTLAELRAHTGLADGRLEDLFLALT
jgi:ABC-2 type transport system ATP-binding protein